MRGTHEQREACRIRGRGLPWEALNEDVSIAACWLATARSGIRRAQRGNRVVALQSLKTVG